MHEVSLLSSLVDIANDHLLDYPSHQVERVVVKVGVMSGVEVDALEFSYNEVFANTRLEGSELVIEKASLIGACHSCSREYEMEQLTDLCPNCQSGGATVISGEEFLLQSLDLHEES